jgi:hypothetical protein
VGIESEIPVGPDSPPAILRDEHPSGVGDAVDVLGWRQIRIAGQGEQGTMGLSVGLTSATTRCRSSAAKGEEAGTSPSGTSAKTRLPTIGNDGGFGRGRVNRIVSTSGVESPFGASTHSSRGVHWI